MAKKIIDSIYDNEGGFLSKYKRIQVGESGWGTLIGLELAVTLLRFLPGALGPSVAQQNLPAVFRLGRPRSGVWHRSDDPQPGTHPHRRAT
jgi:hypothetical protein